MKKLLIVLALCVFAVSCCEVDHNNSQKKEPEKITATSFKVYTQRGGLVCEYYEYPLTGNMEYWTTPGFHWQWWGKTTTYYKTQQLWFGSDNDSGNQMGSPIPVIFNDASDGIWLTPS